MDELPIELRRVETTHTLMTNKHAETLSIKSKSLGDILEIERLDLVRSRSSIPGFCSTSELVLDERSVSSSSSGSKPRLVKQKSYVEEIGLENPEDTAIENLIKDLPDFSCQQLHGKRNVLKQCSMNEELMSTERLEEKERVRRNIMKQASLNEELICKWRTFEAFKDTISPVNASRRFQLLKNGLTNKIKRSTTNIEKVSGISIKNGFVRMLQGWKSGENEASVDEATVTKPTPTSDKVQSSVTMMKRSIEGVERRLSREDGSDSSKDSSLQSDTSVDSEDSFASVIFVPKQDPPTSSAVSEVISSPRPVALQLGTTSAPPSPHVKQAPSSDGQSSKFKLIGVSSLLKQQQQQQQEQQQQQQPVASTTRLGDVVKHSASTVICKDKTSGGISQTTSATSREYHSMTEPTEPDEADTAPLIHAFNDVAKTSVGRESISEDESRKATLKQIKELLIQKPGFATRTKPSFPLVRRASTAASGRLETVTRILPRLLSLELFNPETDDLDSDSSGVSSPESVGSVISVTSDERYIARKDAEKKKNSAQTKEDHSKTHESSKSVLGKTDRRKTEGVRHDESSSQVETVAILADSPKISLDSSCDHAPTILRNEPTRNVFSSTGKENVASVTEAETTRDMLTRDMLLGTDTIRSASAILAKSGRSISSQSMKLLEAAANVASSLEDAVGTAIQRNTRIESQLLPVARSHDNPGDFWSRSSVRARAYLKHNRKAATVDLGGFADESSGDLMCDIDRYCQNSSFDLLNVRRTSGIVSPSLTVDVADNGPDVAAAATCWEECNGLPKETTTWIINEAYDGSEHDRLVNAVQSKPRPEAPEETEDEASCQYKSKSLCDSQSTFEARFDRESKSASDVAEPCKYEVKLKDEPDDEAGFNPKYDEMFRFDLESKDKLEIKLDLASRLISESNSAFTNDAERLSIVDHGNECKLDNPANAKSNLQPDVQSEPGSSRTHERGRVSSNGSPMLLRSNSDDALDFVMVSKTGEFECEVAAEDSPEVAARKKWRSQSGLSMDLSDVGDSMETTNTTTSLSDGSQAGSTARLFTGSMVSLVSSTENTSRCTTEPRRLLQERGRSLDEITTSDPKRKAGATDCLVTTTTDTTTATLSNASSQESLPSDRGGGAITYHQYYHVFREGELDQLINKYVENLHIISSYYDHASWCIVAEKVQVWTI